MWMASLEVGVTEVEGKHCDSLATMFVDSEFDDDQ